jgi:hypothetical protein
VRYGYCRNPRALEGRGEEKEKGEFNQDFKDEKRGPPVLLSFAFQYVFYGSGSLCFQREICRSAVENLCGIKQARRVLSMNDEIDYVEDVDTKIVRDNELRIEDDDLPITVIFESRRQYVLKSTPTGLILNKKD